MTDRRYKYYKAIGDTIILEIDLLFRKYYGETGFVKHYQVVIPEQLVDEVFGTLHGEFGRHPGNITTFIANIEKYYYPNMAQLTRKWPMPCKQFIRKSRLDYRLTRLLRENPNEHITRLEDVMRIDSVAQLPPSGGCKK